MRRGSARKRWISAGVGRSSQDPLVQVALGGQSILAKLEHAEIDQFRVRLVQLGEFVQQLGVLHIFKGDRVVRSVTKSAVTRPLQTLRDTAQVFDLTESPSTEGKD